ncbi:MAG: amino acid-binding protein, partial [Deltaproteobacteria bacterium]|nr:amino acid-binding protein [Deltaproteobacteria bacterium]
PGGLGGILKILHEAGINVEYMYAFVQRSGDNAIIIFRFDELDKAIPVLTGAGVRVLKGEEVYAL